MIDCKCERCGTVFFISDRQAYASGHACPNCGELVNIPASPSLASSSVLSGITVEVLPACLSEAPHSLASDIKDRLDKHAERVGLKSFSELSLHVSVSQWTGGSAFLRWLAFMGPAVCELQVTGSVNGQYVDFSVRKEQRFGIFGGRSPKLLELVLRACLHTIEKRIEEIVGDPTGSELSARWKTLRTISSLSPVVAVPSLFILRGLAEPTKPIPGIVLALMGLAVGLFVLTIIRMLGWVLMPDGFFQSDPRGARMLQIAEIKSPRFFRVVTILGMLFLVALVVALGILVTR